MGLEHYQSRFDVGKFYEDQFGFPPTDQSEFSDPVLEYPIIDDGLGGFDGQIVAEFLASDDFADLQNLDLSGLLDDLGEDLSTGDCWQQLSDQLASTEAANIHLENKNFDLKSNNAALVKANHKLKDRQKLLLILIPVITVLALAVQNFYWRYNATLKGNDQKGAPTTKKQIDSAITSEWSGALQELSSDTNTEPSLSDKVRN